MLKDLMEKVNMCEQVRNFNKRQKYRDKTIMLEMKNAISEKKIFDSS